MAAQHDELEDPFLSLANIDELSQQDHLLDGVRANQVESETTVGKAQDIHEEGFKTLLKDFCHNYQIPFLENNI